MKTPNKSILIAFVAGGISLLFCNSGQLQVGLKSRHKTIESALSSARPGDTIIVHSLPNNRPYSKVALYIKKSDITIKASDSEGRVILSGEGFDYSGRGSTPRAIVQFNRGADRCRLEGFELTGAHNKTHNGAGIRITHANDVTISNCEIHGNDMGVMSNGNGTPDEGRNQRIANCLIHHNGNLSDPGYNHNLYLGGESVTLTGCEVHSSLTGHNVKSRAHRTVIHACYIHDSSNREIDLVDHKEDTTRPESDAILEDNIIVKDKKCRGNRGVIHFGEDIGGDHNGTLHLTNNIIITPFISPVVYLSAKGGSARICDNIICDGGAGQGNQIVVKFSEKLSQHKQIFIFQNWLSHGFPESTSAKGEVPPFRDPENGDYTLKGGKESFMSKPTNRP